MENSHGSGLEQGNWVWKGGHWPGSLAEAVFLHLGICRAGAGGGAGSGELC